MSYRTTRQRTRLRMQRQFATQRGGGALPRVIVGRGADAAAAEHHVAAAEGVAQRVGDQGSVVAHIARPRQGQAASGEQLDHLGQVRIAALARKDLVADDDQGEARRVHALTAVAAGRRDTRRINASHCCAQKPRP